MCIPRDPHVEQATSSAISDLELRLTPVILRSVDSRWHADVDEYTKMNLTMVWPDHETSLLASIICPAVGNVHTYTEGSKQRANMCGCVTGMYHK